MVQNKDATLTKQVVVGLAELPAETAALQIFAGNQDGYGELQAKEGTMISQVVVGLRSFSW